MGSSKHSFSRGLLAYCIQSCHPSPFAGSMLLIIFRESSYGGYVYLLFRCPSRPLPLMLMDPFSQVLPSIDMMMLYFPRPVLSCAYSQRTDTPYTKGPLFSLYSRAPQLLPIGGMYRKQEDSLHLKRPHSKNAVIMA